MADRSDFHPDPLDVLADLHAMTRDQFWATYPSLRAVIGHGFGEDGDLLRHLAGIVHEDRQSRAQYGAGRYRDAPRSPWR